MCKWVNFSVWKHILYNLVILRVNYLNSKAHLLLETRLIYLIILNWVKGELTDALQWWRGHFNSLDPKAVNHHTLTKHQIPNQVHVTLWTKTHQVPWDSCRCEMFLCSTLKTETDSKNIQCYDWLLCCITSNNFIFFFHYIEKAGLVFWGIRK